MKARLEPNDKRIRIIINLFRTSTIIGEKRNGERYGIGSKEDFFLNMKDLSARLCTNRNYLM